MPCCTHTHGTWARGADGIVPPARALPSRHDRDPLIVDVDTGIDDSLALLYLAASPDEADFVAVTCVGGNVDARQVERNKIGRAHV